MEEIGPTMADSIVEYRQDPAHVAIIEGLTQAGLKMTVDVIEAAGNQMEGKSLFSQVSLRLWAAVKPVKFLKLMGQRLQALCQRKLHLL